MIKNKCYYLMMSKKITSIIMNKIYGLWMIIKNKYITR